MYQNSGSGIDYEQNIANIDFSNGPYLVSKNPGAPSDGGYKIFCPFDPGFVYDRLIVSPDPKTLAKPIPSGSILGATIRRRVNDDTKVTLNLNMPSGSRGIQTPSGDGYLIPDDLTDIQQRNVQKIINKLQSENVFQQNTPNDVR